MPFHTLLRRSALGIIPLLLCAAGAPRLYRIDLKRPEHRGDTFTISATGESKQSLTLTVPGQPARKQENAFTIQLDGTIKVALVDDSGEPSRLDCIVSKCLKNGQPLLEPGTVITAENKTSRTEFSANGMPVAPATAQALQIVLNTHQPGQPPTNESIFGTDQPQPVGGHWPINHQAAAQGFTKNGLPISKDAITGEAQLVSIEKTDQGPVMRIQADLKVDRITGVLPDGSELQGGSLSGQYRGSYPVDSSKRPLNEAETMDIHMSRKIITPQNQTGTAEITAHRETRVTYGSSGQ